MAYVGTGAFGDNGRYRVRNYQRVERVMSKGGVQVVMIKASKMVDFGLDRMLNWWLSKLPEIAVRLTDSCLICEV